MEEKAKALARRQRLQVMALQPGHREFQRRIVNENQGPRDALAAMGIPKEQISYVKGRYLSDSKVTEPIVFGLQAHRVSQLEMLRQANKRLMEFLKDEIVCPKCSEEFCLDNRVVLKAVEVFFAGLKNNAAISKFEAAYAEDAAELTTEQIAQQYLRDSSVEVKRIESGSSNGSDGQ